MDDRGLWITEKSGIEKNAVNYFKELSKTSYPTQGATETVVNRVTQKVTNDMNLSLLKEFQASEIVEA
ncbi:unnamed protein product, partial [Ilex paraguariensis]